MSKVFFALVIAAAMIFAQAVEAAQARVSGNGNNRVVEVNLGSGWVVAGAMVNNATTEYVVSGQRVSVTVGGNGNSVSVVVLDASTSNTHNANQDFAGRNSTGAGFINAPDTLFQFAQGFSIEVTVQGEANRAIPDVTIWVNGVRQQFNPTNAAINDRPVTSVSNSVSVNDVKFNFWIPIDTSVAELLTFNIEVWSRHGHPNHAQLLYGGVTTVEVVAQSPSLPPGFGFDTSGGLLLDMDGIVPQNHNRGYASVQWDPTCAEKALDNGKKAWASYQGDGNQSTQFRTNGNNVRIFPAYVQEGIYFVTTFVPQSGNPGTGSFVQGGEAEAYFMLIANPNPTADYPWAFFIVLWCDECEDFATWYFDGERFCDCD